MSIPIGFNFASLPHFPSSPGRKPADPYPHTNHHNLHLTQGLALLPFLPCPEAQGPTWASQVFKGSNPQLKGHSI